MKNFFIIAIIVVSCLIASPMLFLSDAFKKEKTEGLRYWNTYSSAVKSIDPATCGDVTSATIQGNIYESLFCYHFLKRPLEVIPQLADSMPEISEDGLTYTIRLKKGVLYHRNPCFGTDTKGVNQWNTREVLADDFIYAFKRIADYHINTGLAWAFLADRIKGLDSFRQKTKQYTVGDFSRYDLDVEGLKALDKLSLQISLLEPFPQLVYVLAMHVYAPIPHEVIEYWLTAETEKNMKRINIPVHERNPEITKQQQVVGTGPYILKTWKRKWKFILTRNPDFRVEYYPSEGEAKSETWPGDSAQGLLDDAGKRIPFYNEIYLRYIEETYANWMLFLSKRRFVTGIPRETFESVISPGKKLTDSWKSKNIELLTSTSPSIYWIVFNMEDSILGASKSLRQAICLGYDVKNEIEILLNGRGKRAVNIVPSSFKGHKEAGSGPYYRYDVNAAKKKIEESKKELVKAGIINAGEEIPELKLDLSDGPYYMRMAEIAKQQFAKIGLKLKVVFNDWPTLQRKVHNKQAQMYTMGWHADYPDAENFLQLFYSGNIDKGTNNSNYSNAIFDSLYEKARIMQDTPERTVMYVQMISILNEDVPVLILYEPEDYILFYKWMKNVKPHPVGYGFIKYRRYDTALLQKLGGKK